MLPRKYTGLSLKEIITSENNLERILDNLQEGIIAHDFNRRIFFFNREAERMTGYQRREVLGKDCHEAFGFPFCGERCSFCKDKSVVNSKHHYATNITTKTGESRHIEMSITLMTDENRQIIGVLACFKDVTDLLYLKKRAGELTRFANIIGQDSKMQQVFQQISDVADYDYPVSISGETGTGKELVATAIHSESARRGAPFVPINCGALPEGLIESELFGHVKGAFSGALRDKKGRFELADRGTVFLDEIAELSKHMQVKLLRFLQESKFVKVGGEETQSVNVRIICATNKNLKKEVKRGHFREDLFYRLNVIPIHIPPLRERKNDIPLLVEHFLKEAGQTYHRKAPRMTKEALSRIMDYSWPGNVRELQNAVQFAIVKCNGSIIKSDDLPLELRDLKDVCLRPGPSRKLDTDRVMSALTQTGGNKAKAARVLGVGRATLYRFLNDHPNISANL
jgi:PAS domain S-box-containing protein